LTTLFEKYGGFAVISRIVHSYYNKVLDSDQIGDYFENLDMKPLIEHQTKFVASLMGGPASFTNETLKRVHAGLSISREDFDEVANLLRETLFEHNVEQEDINDILGEIESRSPVIISS